MFTALPCLPASDAAVTLQTKVDAGSGVVEVLTANPLPKCTKSTNKTNDESLMIRLCHSPCGHVVDTDRQEICERWRDKICHAFA